MRNFLELGYLVRKSVEGGHMASPHEPWSQIYIGVLPFPFAIPWHKGSQVGDSKVAIYY